MGAFLFEKWPKLGQICIHFKMETVLFKKWTKLDQNSDSFQNGDVSPEEIELK